MKIRVDIQRACEKLPISAAVNFDRPKLCQVKGNELGIQ
jgi:hypothetical protein